MKKFFVLFLLLAGAFQIAGAQDIVYADANKSDVKRMNFEIIGKTASNYLIYKEIKGRHWIAVYDENMHELETVPITVLPKKEELLDLAFYPNRTGAWLVFQGQQDQTVSLEAVKIEANGRILSQPIILDTTQIAYKAQGKLYNHIGSEDHSKLLVFKINRKDREQYKFAAKLFDQDMVLQDESHFTLPMNPDGDYLTGYSLDNQGNLVFVKYNRLKSGYIESASLLMKPAQSDVVSLEPLRIGNIYLDDLKVRIDEKNNRYLLASFFSNEKRGDLNGIYTYAWDSRSRKVAFEKTSLLSNELKDRAKNRSKAKAAFNDYFINNIVVHPDGSFTLAAEVLYTTNYGAMWDRWGYWGSPFYGPYYGGLYSPYWSSWGWGWGWGRWGGMWSPYSYYSPFFYRSYWWGGSGYGNERYHADNVAVIAFDAEGNQVWDNVIVKKQNDTETDGTISYQILLSGNDMHFLLNNTGKISELEDVVMTFDGRTGKADSIKARDKKTDFMPRYAKQVGSHEAIIPVLNHKTITFAKMKF